MSNGCVFGPRFGTTCKTPDGPHGEIHLHDISNREENMFVCHPAKFGLTMNLKKCKLGFVHNVFFGKFQVLRNIAI